MSEFKKTVEQIAEDMRVNFFGYPKQAKCLNCPALMWIPFEGASPGHCDTCRVAWLQSEAARRRGAS